MMYPDDIDKVDKWFDNHKKNYGTYHNVNDGEYSICACDLEEFSDFLREEFPDLIGIRCYFGTGDSAMWFFEADLEEAEFY